MLRPVPPIRYAPSEGLNIAYQVFGDGPVDVVLVPGFISHIEYAWHEPLLTRFFRKLAEFCRVIVFDKRGMGHSDRDPRRDTPTLEQRLSDIAAVMDAANSPAAALLAWSEGGPAAIAFAAAHPDRAQALLLIETTPRFSLSDDFPVGVPREVLETFIETLETDWGSGVGFELYAPSLAEDQRARAWWAAYQRFAATPGAVAASLRMHLDVDVRQLLPTLTLPVLVVHRTNDMVIPVECGRYLGAHIPNARYLEMAGEDHMYWVGDQDQMLAAIRTHLSATAAGATLTGRRKAHRSVRVGWESLTSAELDVVQLIADGMTNHQIARRLHISARTVQTHVTHILSKLELRSRTQVALEAMRHTR